ncbi:MAG TPA: helix-hairpin-helix domain-containing protein, partial [Gemmataceae bacterium]|nr:helix-hairpin-helix domain-containing protein [Gemmataceae bacterium]
SQQSVGRKGHQVDVSDVALAATGETPHTESAVVEKPAETASEATPTPATESDSTAEAPATAPSTAAPAPKLPDRCPLPPEVGEQLAPHSPFRTPHAAFVKTVLDDALTRVLLPSLEREIRHELTDEAEGHAVAVFARNLRSLLLQPPLRSRRVLAIDPGFRTGCKVAVLDEVGNLLEDAVIYPHGKKGFRDKGSKPEKGQEQAGEKAAPTAGTEAPTAAVETTGVVEPPSQLAEGASPTPAPEVQDQAPIPQTVGSALVSEAATPPTSETAPAPAPESQAKPSEPAGPSKREEALAKLREMVVKHAAQVVAIGNGTGCRETEELVAELIATHLPELAYVIVNEAGASVYSVSPVGREEFPTFDSTLRGTISIGRRLQDPLSELVKVDPQSIGVGLYQHDVKRKDLRESLDGVVESCVNQVGVDLNTASVPLLRHVSGLNQMVARELVDYRKQHGPFKSRDQLQHISGVGPARYVQAAGFLKIHQGENPLDSTWIHPESYAITGQILADLGYAPDIVQDKNRVEELQAKLKALSPVDLANRLGAGVPTITDILQSLARPGLDPREELPPPIFKKGILKLEDLQPGMELKGTVLNVVDFGAFVDIGLKDSGLVHISQMANKYIKSPYEVAAVNDVVTVWVLTVDKERHRVSLTMIKPGTERKPGEKRPGPERQQGSRPPRRGRRPAPAPAGQGQGSGPPPGHGRGPRRGPPPPRPATPAGEPATATSTGEGAPPPPPPRPAPPPPRPAHTHHRKHRREAPRPKLSKDALEGKVPLRTFGELSALFAAKKEPPPAPPPPQPEPQPVAEAVIQESPTTPAPVAEAVVHESQGEPAPVQETPPTS